MHDNIINDIMINPIYLIISYYTSSIISTDLNLLLVSVIVEKTEVKKNVVLIKTFGGSVTILHV